MSDTETVSIADLLQDPAVRADPYPTYARVRELGPLVPSPYGAFFVTQHAEVFSVLRDARFSSNARHEAGHDQFVELAGQLGLGDLQDLFERVMLFADP